MQKPLIMVVEDDRIIAEDIQSSLEDLGYGVSACVASGEEAVEKAGSDKPSLVIMDIMLEGAMDGIEAAGIIRTRFDIPVIYLTAYADENMLQRAKVTEPFGYLLKPFDDHALHTTIEMALYKHGAEKKLRETREQFRMLVENIDEVFWIAAPDFSSLIYVSPAFEKIWGRPLLNRSEHMGVWLDSIHPDDRAALQDAVDALHEKKEVAMTYRILRPDGTVRYIHDHAIPVFDDAGGLYRFIGIASDVTEKQSLDNQKARLLSMVSHDIKSPMTAIIGYADILLSDADENSAESIREIAANIKRSCRKLLKMGEDFVTISRMETGDIPLNIGPVNVAELISEINAEFAEPARKKRLSLEFAVDKDVPALIADRALLDRAISNLVQNAVNYTPKGGSVKLTARASGDAPYPEVAFCVTDTGPGIPEDEKERIFEQYYRSDSAKSVKGSGLGLTIVRAAAEAHGGRVELETRVGEGSRFTIFVPAAPKGIFPPRH